jgi:predicted DCC family thiol-disulfide oxidoreductase YuxK
VCRTTAARVIAWDREHRVALIPFQDERAVAAFAIEAPALAAAMHLLLPDGRVFAGADAIPELLRLLPGKRWMAPWFDIPGARILARRVYQYVAARRHCGIRGLPTAAGEG